MPRQAPTVGDPYRGRKIGKYEILTRLSVGGMAELFLAFTSGPGGFRKFVALKQILPDVKTEEFVKMFLDEARITAAFAHPNIGQVYELGLEEDELYLAMEFLPGQNLEQVMIAASKVRPLPVGFAARVARDVCLGLHYAHNFSAPSGRKVAVVHRDMAPRNVMITYDGMVKVIDFGIAKAKGRIARTTVGMVKGTSGYMSPEQVRGFELDGRSDLFTAAVLLHEMLCSERLFDTSDEDAMMRAIANADIAPPRASNPDVPEALDAVVMRALAKDPAKRFATGREMAKAIEAAMGSELFDEESIAEVMQALFAEKRLKTLALLDNASHDDERVSKVVEALLDDKGESTVAEMPAQEDSGFHPTLPTIPVPAQLEAPRSRARSSSAGTRAPSRRSGTGDQPSTPPAKPRPFPAPPRKLPDSSSRKARSSFEDDAPTQIGPVSGITEQMLVTEPTSVPAPAPAPAREPEAREGRRSPKVGSYTLGAAEPKAPAPPKPLDDDSDTSEMSDVAQVSRVSRALKALDNRSRRGLWIVAALVLVGIVVLALPASVKSRIGALVTSAARSASERSSPATEPQVEPTPPAPTQGASPAQPEPDAYEPPPPVEGHEPQGAVKQGTDTPSKPRAKAPPTPSAVEAAAAASQARSTRRSEPPATEGKPEGQALNPPVEVAPEPEEPSVGPAEVDPSVKPMELDAPSAMDEEQ